MSRKLTEQQVKTQLQITMDEEQAALDAALLSRLHPASKRLIVTKPVIGGNHNARERASGVIIPDFVTIAEAGVVATVLACHDDVTDEIQPGSEVVVPEYNGNPIFLGQETPYWYICEADIQVIITPETPDA